MADKDTAPKNKGGRPRKYPADRRRHNQTVRVTEDVRARLLADAAANQRSVSEEIEAIIMAAHAEDRLRAVIREELAARSIYNARADFERTLDAGQRPTEEQLAKCRDALARQGRNGLAPCG